MKRRTFIGTSIAAAAVYAARPSWAAASEHEIKRVGLQLYTVRTEMPKDFEGTIAKVAATGYKEVEFAGYFDHSAKEVRAIVDKNGLTAPSTHLGHDLIGYGSHLRSTRHAGGFVQSLCSGANRDKPLDR